MHSCCPRCGSENFYTTTHVDECEDCGYELCYDCCIIEDWYGKGEENA